MPSDDTAIRGRPRAPYDRYPGLDRPVFFIHLQKTAGTTLLFQFRNFFHDPEMFPNPADGHPALVGPQFIPDRLREGWAARRDTLRVIIGHYPYCLMEELDGDFITMTLLRDPVERTLSYLRHNSRIHPEEAHRSLDSLYADDFRFRALVRNHMVKMLGMTTAEMGSDGMLTQLECTEAHVERAQQRLTTIDAVGLQDDLAGFCAEIDRRWGLPVRDHPKVNVTDPVPVPAGLRERIAADNQLDMRLWRFAQDLVAQRAAQATVP